MLSEWYDNKRSFDCDLQYIVSNCGIVLVIPAACVMK